MVTGTLTSNVKITVIIIIDPNHLNILIHIENNISAINPVLNCQSLIAGQLLDQANSIADQIDFHSINSSRNLSNIKTFASTAIHNANIIAAIPLKERA